MSDFPEGVTLFELEGGKGRVGFRGKLAALSPRQASVFKVLLMHARGPLGGEPIRRAEIAARGEMPSHAVKGALNPMRGKLRRVGLLISGRTGYRGGYMLAAAKQAGEGT